MESDDEMNRLEEMLKEKSDVTPRPSTILMLHEKLGERKSVIRQMLAVKIPVWAAAAVVAIAMLMTMLLVSGNSGEPKVVEKFIVKNDTLFVTRTDTVKIEKVIYRDRGPAKIIQVRKNDSGSSMKDKEELQELLVSGSD